MIKTRKIIFIAVLAIAGLVCLRLVLFETTLKYGLVLLAVILLSYLIWRAFVKTGQEELKRSEEREAGLMDEIASLKKTVFSLDRQLAEKEQSRLNVIGLSPILHVAVLNIDSSFVRPYIREEGGLRFEGALRADICAEYGIKLEEVRFKYDRDTGELSLKNFHPGMISYSKKQLTWEIAHSSRTVSLLGHELPSFTDGSAEAFTKRMCDSLRTDLEREIDERQIEEFAWLSPMLTEQVTDMFRLLLNRPDARVTIADDMDDDGSYIDFNAFRQITAGPEEA